MAASAEEAASERWASSRRFSSASIAGSSLPGEVASRAPTSRVLEVACFNAAAASYAEGRPPRTGASVSSSNLKQNRHKKLSLV